MSIDEVRLPLDEALHRALWRVPHHRDRRELTGNAKPTYRQPAAVI